MDTTAPLAGPLLTPAEEVELALDIEAGLLAADALAHGRRPHEATDEELRWLVEAGQRARRRYVEANLRLVSMVARQAGVRAGLTEADLFQEGCLGLMIAVDRYDCRRGCRFATYALLWIRAFTGAASARLLGTLNLPTSRASQLRHARGIEAVLAQELGRQPTAGEVAEALGRSADWTSRLLTHEPPPWAGGGGRHRRRRHRAGAGAGRSRRVGGPDVVAGGVRAAGAGAATRLRRRAR